MVSALDVLVSRPIDEELQVNVLKSSAANFSMLRLLDYGEELFQTEPFRAASNDLRQGITLLQKAMLEHLNFTSLLSANFDQCVFMFDRKQRLTFLSEPPHNLKFRVLSGNLNFSTALLPFDEVIKSEELAQYINNFLEYREAPQNDVLNAKSIALKIIFDGKRKNSKSYYFAINAATFISLELGNKKREAEKEEFQKEMRSLAAKKRKLFGLNSSDQIEGEGLALGQPNKTSKRKKSYEEDMSEEEAANLKADGQKPKPLTRKGSGDLEEQEEDPDEMLDDVLDLPVYKRKVSLTKLRTVRHSISGASDTTKALQKSKEKEEPLRRTRTLDSSKSFYQLVKNSYAMEFVPDHYTERNKLDDLKELYERRRNGINESYLLKMMKSKADSDMLNYVEKIDKSRLQEAEESIEDIVLLDWSHDIVRQTEAQDFGLVMKIFRPHITQLSIDPSELLTFAMRCKYFYERNNNPFHNWKHGVAVLFAANHFYKKIAFLTDYFQPHQRFAFLLAAFGHDLDHTGKNNVFEINTRSKLAMKYNDQSPLEQHHIRTLFKIINSSDNPILKGFEYTEYFEVRSLIIDCILSTDMKVHFSLVKKFETLETDPKGMTPKEQKQLALSMVVHSADICGSAKNIEVAREWSLRISKEFANQYKLEMENKVPLTPYFKDLNIEMNLWKSEISFLRFIVQPLFTLLSKYDFDLSEEKEAESAKKKQAVKYYGKINEIITTNIKIYEDKLARATAAAEGEPQLTHKKTAN